MLKYNNKWFLDHSDSDESDVSNRSDVPRKRIRRRCIKTNSSTRIRTPSIEKRKTDNLCEYISGEENSSTSEQKTESMQALQPAIGSNTASPNHALFKNLQDLVEDISSSSDF